MDCPCCVPELYEMGGDINCNFTSPAVPVPEPALTPSPTEVWLLPRRRSWSAVADDDDVIVALSGVGGAGVARC